MRTVQSEPNFVSEWQAQDEAFHLAQKLCILQTYQAQQYRESTWSVDNFASCFASTANKSVLSKQRGANKHQLIKPQCQRVTFSEVLCIRIGEEESATFHDFQVHVDAIESVVKPWSLHAKGGYRELALESPIASQPVDQCRRHHNRPDFVPQVDLSMHALHPKHPFVQSTSDSSRDISRAEVSSDFDSARKPQWMLQCTQDRCSFNAWYDFFHINRDVLPHDSLINQQCWNDQLDYAMVSRDAHTCFTPVLVPKSKQLRPPITAQHRFQDELKVIARLLSTNSTSQRVSFPGDPFVMTKGVKRTSWSDMPASCFSAQTAQEQQLLIAAWQTDNPRCIQVRLEHESPIPPAMRNNPDDPDQDDDDMEEHDQPVFPAFVHNLINRMDRIGVDPYDNDFDLAVRTWYIDHRTIHRWTAPRLLQLMGPPQGWEAQIQAVWTDQINTEEWFDVIVIEPDPPRPAQHAFVV